MFKIIALVISSVLGLGVWVLAQPARHVDPDPQLLRLAVRATVHAWPTPEAREIEVTRIVEVTRVVEVTRIVDDAVAPEDLAPRDDNGTPEPPPDSPVPPTSPPPTPVAPTPEPVPSEPVSHVDTVNAAAAQASEDPVAENPVAEDEGIEDRSAEPRAAENSEAMPVSSQGESVPAQSITEEPRPESHPEPVQEPVAEPAPALGCGVDSSHEYATIPIEGAPAEHPAHEHGDLNPALRGSRALDAHLGLVEINGPTDGDAPQLAGMFGDGRVPGFAGMRQAFDWNWGCGGRGCRGEALAHPEVTLAVVQTIPGEALAPARRNAEIYGGGFVAMVLYADEQAITLGYTREDSVANGYALHLEHICTDPHLLAAYRAANAQGRGGLPALRNGEILGTAAGEQMHIAIRDRGMFKDPRSRKDWWAQH